MVYIWKRGWVLALVLIFPLFVHAQDQTALAPTEIKGQALYIPFPVAITLDGKVDDWMGVPSAVVDRGTMLLSKPGRMALRQMIPRSAVSVIYRLHGVTSTTSARIPPMRWLSIGTRCWCG
jgi:hypothetical protein